MCQGRSIMPFDHFLKIVHSISTDLCWSLNLAQIAERLSLPVAPSILSLPILECSPFRFDRSLMIRLFARSSSRCLSFLLVLSYLSPVSSKHHRLFLFFSFFLCCFSTLQMLSFHSLIVIYEQVCKEKVIGKYRSLQRFAFESCISPERYLFLPRHVVSLSMIETWKLEACT